MKGSARPPRKDADAPSIMKTIEKPEIKAKVATITLRRMAALSPAVSSSKDDPEMNVK